MEKTGVKTIHCTCGHEQDVKLCYMIEVPGDEDKREKILDNTLFMFECENCGYKLPMSYSSLYHDRENKLLVYMVPGYDSDDNEKFRKMIAGFGDLMPADKREGYVSRIAPNPNALKEKIMIREEGLDDRIVELMKLYYISQMQETLQDEEIIDVLFDNSNDINGFVFLLKDKNPMFGEMNMEAYSILEEDFKDAADELTPEGFAEIDLRWAEALASNE